MERVFGVRRRIPTCSTKEVDLVEKETRLQVLSSSGCPVPFCPVDGSENGRTCPKMGMIETSRCQFVSTTLDRGTGSKNERVRSHKSRHFTPATSTISTGSGIPSNVLLDLFSSIFRSIIVNVCDYIPSETRSVRGYVQRKQPRNLGVILGTFAIVRVKCLPP